MSRDLGAGDNDGGDSASETDSDSDGPFALRTTANSAMDRLRRWRRAALVLNKSRRFSYTLELKKEEEKQHLLKKINSHAQVVRAAPMFQNASRERIKRLVRDRDLGALEQQDGVRGLSLLLNTDLENGIPDDSGEILRRREVYGSNTIHWKKQKRLWRFLLESSQDVTWSLLMLAAIASLFLGIKTKTINHGWLNEASIAFTIVIVVIITAISNYKQSLQFEKSSKEKTNVCLEVIRGGRRVRIAIYDIVVGDILPLRNGDLVPADGVLSSAYSLQIDESRIPGESKIVQKDLHMDPFLISGSKVKDGIGTMLVTSVGMNTPWGLLMTSNSQETIEKTPLQVFLNGIATATGLISVSLAIVVFLFQSWRYFMGQTKSTNGTPVFLHGKTTAGEATHYVIGTIILGITIVAMAVPIGLPLAVKLNCAYSTRKMVADKALVQTLSACETIGSATTILCHKTGVLTLDQMKVVDACAGGNRMQHVDSISELSPLLASLIFEGIAQNTDGGVFFPEGGIGPEVSGSPTERAILDWGVKLGMKFNDVLSTSSILHVSPFKSNEKCRGVVLKLHDSRVCVHWKGAAKSILNSCTQYMEMDNVAYMNEEKVSYFGRIIEEMSTRGLRCVALAYRIYKVEEFPGIENVSGLPEDGLILLAIIGIKYSCRPGMRDAVQLCHTAGVKVRMVTGDDLLSAKAVAIECGILTSGMNTSEPTIIEGEAFRSLSVPKREEVAESVLVMARSSPGDNLLLIQTLKKKGHAIAAIGKGIYDGQMLHEADVGLAMGIDGSAIAKESSNIIVSNDEFATVFKAIRWSRSLHANILKFVQFRLTISAAALVICVIVASRCGDLPLNVPQLLLVNLLIDIFGALALASEPPIDHIMQMPPFRIRESFMSKLMWLKFAVQVAYQVTALLILNLQGESILQLKGNNLTSADKVKNTLIFNSFVFCQVFSDFEFRNQESGNITKGIIRNHLFLWTIALTVVLQIIAIELMGISIDWKRWLIALGIGLFGQVASRFPFKSFPYR